MNFFRKHRRVLITFIVIIAILLMLAAIFSSETEQFMEKIRVNKNALQNYVDHHYWVGLAVYLGMFVVAAFVPFPLISVIVIVGGMFIGFWDAFLYACLFGTGMALVAFFVGRYCMRNYLAHRYRTELDEFYHDLRHDEIVYFIALRVMPILPFAFVNYFAGLTTIRWYRFMVTSILGMLPDYIIYALTGSGVASLDSMDSLLSPRYIIIYGLAALLLIYPSIKNKVLRKLEEKDRLKAGDSSENPPVS